MKAYSIAVVNQLPERTEWINRDEPWLTSPAITAIDSLLLSSDRVLEWGGGSSTPFFLKRCGAVHTVEGNPDWAVYLLAAIADRPELLKKWSLHFVPAGWNPTPLDSNRYWGSTKVDLSVAETLEMESKYLTLHQSNYDFVIVDGAIRPLCLLSLMSDERVVARKGIIVDNTESEVTSSLLEVLLQDYNSRQSSDARFVRIDFHESDLSRIPIHQNGQHVTSVLLRQAFFERSELRNLCPVRMGKRGSPRKVRVHRESLERGRKHLARWQSRLRQIDST